MNGEAEKGGGTHMVMSVALSRAATGKESNDSGISYNSCGGT